MTLLVVASFIVSAVGSAALRPVRTSGPTVKRFSGLVLLAVGAWFVVLAFIPNPIIAI